MAKVMIFVKDGMPAKAVITGTPSDDMDNFQLLDTVSAFIAGDAVVLADSRDHEIEVVPVSGAALSIDYDRLARAISDAAPRALYGDVHVTGGPR